MPRSPRPLPDTLGDCFRVGEAVDAGVSRARLRAGDLEAPFRGVRIAARRDASPMGEPVEGEPVDGGPLALDRRRQADVRERARAYAVVAPAGSFFVGRTAAVLWGLPVSPGAELELGAWAPAHAPRARGVRGVKVMPELATLREVSGFRVTSPASTWAMLGRVLTVRELIVVGDAVVRVPRDRSGTRRPERSLTTIPSLQAAVDAGRRLGVARLREALTGIRVGSASPLESEYRLDAERAGIPEPDLDREIRDAAGRLLGISEIVYPRWRVVVEIEGDHHRTSRRQWDRDIEKYAAYAAAGWEVVRLTARHVRSAVGVEQVAATLARRGWRP